MDAVASSLWGIWHSYQLHTQIEESFHNIKDLLLLSTDHLLQYQNYTSKQDFEAALKTNMDTIMNNIQYVKNNISDTCEVFPELNEYFYNTKNVELTSQDGPDIFSSEFNTLSESLTRVIIYFIIFILQVEC